MLLLAIEISLNLSTAGLVENEGWESFAHFRLSEVEVGVELGPELFFSWGGSLIVPSDLVHTKGRENAESGLVSLFSLEVSKFTLADKDEK